MNNNFEILTEIFFSLTNFVDPQDVLSYSESFIVQICSVHRIKDDWGNM